jgi:hypothetical protein
MFCRNCDKELTGAPEICVNYGAKPMADISFCPWCGVPTTPNESGNYKMFLEKL